MMGARWPQDAFRTLSFMRLRWLRSSPGLLGRVQGSSCPPAAWSELKALH